MQGSKYACSDSLDTPHTPTSPPPHGLLCWPWRVPELSCHAPDASPHSLAHTSHTKQVLTTDTTAGIRRDRTQRTAVLSQRAPVQVKVSPRDMHNSVVLCSFFFFSVSRLETRTKNLYRYFAHWEQQRPPAPPRVSYDGYPYYCRQAQVRARPATRQGGDCAASPTPPPRPRRQRGITRTTRYTTRCMASSDAHVVGWSRVEPRRQCETPTH